LWSLWSVGCRRFGRRDLHDVRRSRIGIIPVWIVVRRRHRHRVIRPPEGTVHTPHDDAAEKKAKGRSIRGIPIVIISVIASVISARIVMAAVVVS